jgi:hypothetical protein
MAIHGAAIWDRRYADAVRQADDGLLHTPAGTVTVRLYAIRARALAGCGEHAQARAAITAAERARADSHPDELHDGLAGEFAFDDAKLSDYRALSRVDRDDPPGAEHAAEVAMSLCTAADRGTMLSVRRSPTARDVRKGREGSEARRPACHLFVVSCSIEART